MKVTALLLAGILSILLPVASASADSLKSAVQAALTSNPQLKASDANFRALTYDLLYTGVGFQPTVTLSGEAGQEYVDNPTGLAPADNRDAKFNSDVRVVAELTVFDGFKRANGVYAAAARVDQGAFELLDASETMALMVAEQHINIARQQQLLRVARRNQARLRKIYDQAQTLLDGGSLPASDFVQIEMAQFTAQVTIADIQRRLQEASAGYKRLTGKAPPAGLQVPKPVRPPSSMEEYVKDSVHNSYRVRSAGANVDVRAFEKSMAEAEFAPQVKLRAGASAGRNLDGSRGSEKNVFVGVGLSWQLYGGKRAERRASLDERKNEALYQRMAVVRDVEELATIAWTSYQINSLKRDILVRQVDASQTMLDNFEAEFEMATRGVLDLMVATNRLYNAQIERVNSDAILSFSGFRALAAQSRLANHFGVAQSNRVLASQIAPSVGQKPRDVISKGRLLLDK